MSLFLLAALVAYLLWHPLTQRSMEGGKRATRILVGTGIFVLLVVAMGIITTGSLHYYRVFVAVRRIVLGPEMAQTMLGALAGALCHGLLRPGATDNATGGDGGGDRSESRPWNGHFVMLAGVVATAIFAPYIPALLSRMTGVKTPYAELYFVAPADKQRRLEVQRDLIRLVHLADLTYPGRFIDRDCGQKALEAGGMEVFKKDHKDRFETFADALTFHADFQKLTILMRNAQFEGRDIEDLKLPLRSIAQKLFRALAQPEVSKFSEVFKAALDEVKTQKQKLIDEGIKDKLPKKKQESSIEEPFWCKDEDENRLQRLMSEAGRLRRLVDTTPYVHFLVADLFLFTGNTEAAIKVMRRAAQISPNDINVNVYLAETLYLGERDFTPVFTYFEDALQAVEVAAKQAAASASQAGVDVMIREKLRERYLRGRFYLKLRLAYLAAQADVRWPMAQAYAEENYVAYRTGTLQSVWFPCSDVDEQLYVQDTYAYIKMAFEARKPYPDIEKVREARWLFEDIMAYLKQEAQQEEQEESKDVQGGSRELSCLHHELRKLWLQRVSSHLTQAEAMLR